MIEDVNDLTEVKKLNLYLNENTRVVKWSKADKSVYVSFSKRGKAIIAHIAARRKNRKYLRKAVNDICNAFFLLYDWCQIVIGVIDKQSVLNLVYNCGFFLIKCAIIDNRMVSIVGRGRHG